MDDLDDAEANLAAAIFSLPEVRDAAHEWLEGLLDELQTKGKLAATAQVVLTPEGCEGRSEVGMMLSIAFVPLDRGQSMVETLMPMKGGVVH